MFLVQAWLNLSDGATEDALCDSLAVRDSVGSGNDVPDATTLLRFRHVAGKDEPCQYDGQGDPGFYAACIASGSHARALSKRPESPSVASAGTRSPMGPWGRRRSWWDPMDSVAPCLVVDASGRRSRWHRPLLGVPRSDPAAALPWQPPALPTGSPVSCAAAHAAGPAPARWLPRSPWDMAPRPRIRASMPSRGRRRRGPPPCRPECPSTPPCARAGRPRRRGRWGLPWSRDGPCRPRAWLSGRDARGRARWGRGARGRPVRAVPPPSTHRGRCRGCPARPRTSARGGGSSLRIRRTSGRPWAWPRPCGGRSACRPPPVSRRWPPRGDPTDPLRLRPRAIRGSRARSPPARAIIDTPWLAPSAGMSRNPSPARGPWRGGAAASLGDSLSAPGSRMRPLAAPSPLRSPAPSWVTLPALLCLRVRSLGALPPVPGPAARFLMPFFGPASRALLWYPAASRRHSPVWCLGVPGFVRDFAFSISLALTGIPLPRSAGAGGWATAQRITAASPCCPTVHLRATRDFRHAEPPGRRHRNVLPNARMSDSRSCVEPDTPHRGPGVRRTI